MLSHLCQMFFHFLFSNFQTKSFYKLHLFIIQFLKECYTHFKNYNNLFISSCTVLLYVFSFNTFHFLDIILDVFYSSHFHCLYKFFLFISLLLPLQINTFYHLHSTLELDFQYGMDSICIFCLQVHEQLCLFSSQIGINLRN